MTNLSTIGTLSTNNLPGDLVRFSTGGESKNVEVVSICSIEIPDSMTYAESGVFLREWCAKNGASYYAAPREQFDRLAAIRLAIREGNSKVVVEDLS